MTFEALFPIPNEYDHDEFGSMSSSPYPSPTKVKNGKVELLRDVGDGKVWHLGTKLYRVDPPIEISPCGFLTETNHVIVAVSPRTSDHGQPETTIFAASGDGNLYHETVEEEDIECLPSDYSIYEVKFHDIDDPGCEIGPRVIGTQDPERALLELGYELQ